MPNYKLTYFNLKGRGELSRLLFAASDVKFEDVRIDMANWNQLKASMPFGQMPVLEVDGKKLAQSKAIAMFLAREFKLAGANNWDQARCHMILDSIEDFWGGLPGILYNRSLSDEEKGKKIVEYRDTKMKPLGDALERCVKESLKEGFIVGGALTIADIAILWIWDLLADPMFRALDANRWREANFPTLDKHYKAMLAQPRLKAYMDKRASSSK